MPSTQLPWKKVTGPSAGLVQQHYVEGRIEALYRRNKNLEAQVKQALASAPLLTGMKLGSGDKWLQVYEKVNRGLQAAQLTINFDAKRWFTTENNYATYSQAYQRSGRSGAGAQLLGDALNPAVYRAQIDDKITFNNATGAGAGRAPQRGLMPGRQDLSRVKEQMEFRPNANERAVPNPAEPGKTQKFADSSNPRFNADTKQVFAALNYGRRLHGSNITYGTSHMVLDPKFKVNALYYPGDTFYTPDASQQAAFHVLGSVLAWAKPHLLEAIVQSCFFDSRLPDTTDAHLLLEGHVFGELAFTGNITELVVDAPRGSVVLDNARKFATKHGAKLVMVAPPG